MIHEHLIPSETRCFVVNPLYQPQHYKQKNRMCIKQPLLIKPILNKNLGNTIFLIIFFHERLKECGTTRHDLILHEPHCICKTCVRHNPIVAGENHTRTVTSRVSLIAVAKWAADKDHITCLVTMIFIHTDVVCSCCISHSLHAVQDFLLPVLALHPHLSIYITNNINLLTPHVIIDSVAIIVETSKSEAHIQKYPGCVHTNHII